MSKRTVAIVGVMLLVPALAVAVFFGTIEYIEHQRVADATPAFEPLIPLGATFLSQPVAFQRQCRYLVDFPEHCGLSDDNIHVLTSLNSLPESNFLEVYILSRDVTDRSLPVLLSITTLDGLDVTETSISDAGIAELKARLPDCIVLDRDPT